LLPLGLNNVGLAWSLSPFSSAWLRLLADRFHLIHYDGRGQGMSSRGLDDATTFAQLDSDLEAVVDATGIDNFVLMGWASAAHTSVRYAVDHPGRVTALVLVSPTIAMSAYPQSLPLGIGRENWEHFLHIWESEAGGGSDRAIEYFKLSSTQRDFVIRRQAFIQSDLSGVLSRLSVPVLIIQPRDFVMLPGDEVRRFAASIPNTRLILTDGTMLGDAEQGVGAIEAFLADNRSSNEPSVTADGVLSPRELEVLRLLAAGKSNAHIAEELVISQNTVIRHVSNIYAKTGATNRAEATSYAHRHAIV
jgi:pimeloyl-ACP methyl ester carboxylesterase/DNA-binding CsgD family transcriptional regulator